MSEVKGQIAQALAVTSEIMGAELSKAAMRVMIEDLAEHPIEAVLKALTRCRREHKGRLSLAAVMSYLDTGHPGVEQAWAMVPKDEYDSAMLTPQILRAMGVAMPLYSDGDKIGARMAFKETYANEVAKGDPVSWVPSFGQDSSGRADCLIDGVQTGRITQERALQLAGAVTEQVTLALGSVKPSNAIDVLAKRSIGAA